MREIGRIKQVHVATSAQASLKIAHGSHEAYNPTPRRDT